MEHSFGGPADFTLGIEEELLVGGGRKPRARACERRIAGRDGAGRTVRPTRSLRGADRAQLSGLPQCREAIASLNDLRGSLREAGGTAIGAGIHPAGRFGDVRIVRRRALRARGERTARVGGADTRLRPPRARRHAGPRDGDPCLQRPARAPPAARGACRELAFLARASTPGFASARRILRRGFPRVEIPSAVPRLRRVRRGGAGCDGGCRGRRLHLRVVGGPAPPAVRHRRGARDGQPVVTARAWPGSPRWFRGSQSIWPKAPREPVRREVIAEASFRAGRDGIAATLPDGRLATAGARDRGDVLALVRPHARELGSEAPLEEVERILREGNGADRQRAAHDSGGMPAVLE